MLESGNFLLSPYFYSLSHCLAVFVAIHQRQRLQICLLRFSSIVVGVASTDEKFNLIRLGSGWLEAGGLRRRSQKVKVKEE